ncbi:unnamed protein product [Ostreobium quekettii]|uniref:Uncharacterized protein n=1 Tax=Ostreobium quekettii TaxID=121088 RepID=A0A8S1J4A0_9CHLO|nr:unnamed protein product [Ostreobium quekettii]
MMATDEEEGPPGAADVPVWSTLSPPLNLHPFYYGGLANCAVFWRYSAEILDSAFCRECVVDLNNAVRGHVDREIADFVEVQGGGRSPGSVDKSVLLAKAAQLIGEHRRSPYVTSLALVRLASEVSAKHAEPSREEALFKHPGGTSEYFPTVDPAVARKSWKFSVGSDEGQPASSTVTCTIIRRLVPCVTPPIPVVQVWQYPEKESGTAVITATKTGTRPGFNKDLNRSVVITWAGNAAFAEAESHIAGQHLLHEFRPRANILLFKGVQKIDYLVCDSLNDSAAALLPINRELAARDSSLQIFVKQHRAADEGAALFNLHLEEDVSSAPFLQPIGMLRNLQIQDTPDLEIAKSMRAVLAFLQISSEALQGDVQSIVQHMQHWPKELVSTAQGPKLRRKDFGDLLVAVTAIYGSAGQGAKLLLLHQLLFEPLCSHKPGTAPNARSIRGPCVAREERIEVTSDHERLRTALTSTIAELTSELDDRPEHHEVALGSGEATAHESVPRPRIHADSQERQVCIEFLEKLKLCIQILNESGLDVALMAVGQACLAVVQKLTPESSDDVDIADFMWANFLQKLLLQCLMDTDPICDWDFVVKSLSTVLDVHLFPKYRRLRTFLLEERPEQFEGMVQMATLEGAASLATRLKNDLGHVNAAIQRFSMAPADVHPIAGAPLEGRQVAQQAPPQYAVVVTTRGLDVLGDLDFVIDFTRSESLWFYCRSAERAGTLPENPTVLQSSAVGSSGRVVARLPMQRSPGRRCGRRHLSDLQGGASSFGSGSTRTRPHESSGEV